MITVTDLAGNSTSFSFVYDKTAPSLSIKKGGSSGIAQSSGSSYFNANETLYVAASDTNWSSIKLNTTAFTLNSSGIKSSVITNYSGLIEGKNVIIATDHAGNSTSFTLYFDKTAPVITLLKGDSSGTAQTSGNSFFKSNDVYYLQVSDISNYSCFLNEVKESNKIYCSSDASFSSETISTLSSISLKEGENKIIVRDFMQNESTFSFVYDITVPTLVVKKGGSSGTVQTSGNSFFKASDTLFVAASDTNWEYLYLNSTNIGVATKIDTITNWGTNRRRESRSLQTRRS